MLLTGALGARYTEFDLVSLPPPQLDERRDGVGTISFGPTFPAANWVGYGWPGARTGAAMVAVRDAGRVFRMIADARAEALSRTGSGA